MTTRTLTLEIPDSLHAALVDASKRTGLTTSELGRRALAAYVLNGNARAGDAPAALARAGDLVGCFEGGPKDLASNPRCMREFGK